MKRGQRILAAVLLVLCVCMSTAMADTYYVKPDIESPLSLRDEYTNEVLTTVPAGTPLEPDGVKSTDLCAYVTYGGYSGLVLWNYLTRVAPSGDGGTQTRQPAPPPTAEPAPVITPVPAPPAPEVLTLRAVGAVLQRANGKNKAEGVEMSEMTVTAADNIVVTARVPRGKKIDYWVLNGVRYDFLHTVPSIRMTGFDRSWTVEVVFKKTDSATLLTAAEIQAARTGETLIAKVISGEMCHIKEGTKGGGGWITSFDFTNDYNNRATGAPEQGGQYTAKIRATIPRGKRVAGWKFDETELYPSVAVKEFVVRTLDTSMTYEPIFGKASETKPPVTDPPTPAARYVTVTCRGCDFSGGGYSHATSGSVPAGTKITVYTNWSGGVSHWVVNGTTLMSGDWYNQSNTITRTINSNTTIVCYMQIN
ncbi:MAG: hypothetical protein IKP10_00100 [Clostridia bacterium]|nr:hypothetical protein [Clostridia bacterium]